MGWLSVTHFAHFLANTCMSHRSATWEENRICRDTRAGKKLDPKPEESLALRSIVTQSIQADRFITVTYPGLLRAASYYQTILNPKALRFPQAKAWGPLRRARPEPCPIGIDRITGLTLPPTRKTGKSTTSEQTALN